MSGAIALLPKTVTKTDSQMNVKDYQYILEMQYQFLLLYEAGKAIEFLEQEGKY